MNSQPPPSTPGPADATRPLLLVVDDNDGSRYVKSRILRRAGYAVLEASTGESALALVRRYGPDLVLLDMRLPDIDGLRVCQLIKDDPESGRTLILHTSGNTSNPRYRAEALDHGADSYLVEPVEPEELVASVKALLRLRQAEEAYHRTSQALRDNELLFRQLADNLSDVLWIFDPAERRFLFVSPAFFALSGRPPEALQNGGSRSFEWIDPRDRERVRTACDSMLRDGRLDIEFSLLRPDGEARQVRARAFPVTNVKGELYRVAGVCEDVTEQKRAEKMLVEEERRKDDFLAMLVHELRNPLAPMRSAADLMMHLAPSREDNFKARDIIARQLYHLTRLVDDLLDISRFTQGRIVLRHDLVELRNALSTAVETVKPLIESRNHTLRLSVPEGPMPVRGDLVRLTQIFGNLLNNAAKYTPPDGLLTLDVTADQGMVTVRITDNGTGLSPERVRAMRDSFATTDSGAVAVSGGDGPGIGLSLVHKLVSLHGGRLSVESAGPGHGSTFIVSLPVEPWRSWKPSTRSLHQPAGRPRNVLVVDDNVDALEAMAMTLEALGHTVITALDGGAAMVRALKYKPDVVLLDLGMPGMDGFEIAQRLRAIPDLAHMRIIALTGYSQPADRVRTKAAGFDHHLTKPVDLEELSRVLNADGGASGDGAASAPADKTDKETTMHTTPEPDTTPDTPPVPPGPEVPDPDPHEPVMDPPPGDIPPPPPQRA
ncbi:response regulator [Cupriavidus respiraculi]|uniref:histidine kinase n=1 Tax=Cupriavidus respiraculi TaxID=195930 RepID=A0ABM8XIK7_9BURK|nr:response regulator [Cupriavidus respiraculi]MBY4948400.1 response regulator [Cupriavidus respiraculi]CAG9179995.1 Sensor histidine kinase RcsC [Cupriavidus respiraculi]